MEQMRTKVNVSSNDELELHTLKKLRRKSNNLKIIYIVSFFGDSYISMPLQEAKLSTNVRLKFKTRHENGLIFATAGRIDSCVLQMFSGILRLSMNIGTHPIEVITFFSKQFGINCSIFY